MPLQHEAVEGVPAGAKGMITSLQIQGYRGFERFEMSGLGRVTLLVGTNNCGKTSVLEALYLLASRGDPWALWEIVSRRGERVYGEPDSGINPAARRLQPELDIHHLFRGHALHVGAKFTISARNQYPEHTISFAISEILAGVGSLSASEEGGVSPSRRVLNIKGTPAPAVSVIPLNRSGSVSTDYLDTPSLGLRSPDPMTAAQFVTPESLTGDELSRLWDRISLTPDEGLVLRALQYLDRDIERVAVQTSQPQYYGSFTRGGFIAKFRGLEQPVPIGSMGDGMWRMLAMAIAITQCKGGFLLVDEIDAGLHYTAMADMWKLIYNAAEEFDVQVFATTHSYDCVCSLAPMCHSSGDGHSITVQRIEAGKSKAIPYNESEIKTAVERGLEIR